jgi:predicted nucleic acid-binding protein
MSADIFVDTNVLVYARDATESSKQEQAQAWMDFLWRSRTGRISFQVLQEFYVTVTEKLKPGLLPERARKDVQALFAWDPLPVNRRVIEEAWGLQTRYQISWWDALIVSAALIADCRYLLSEDLKTNQKISSLKVISPFQSSPHDVDLIKRH